jgi:hypothetical protein
MELRIEPAGRFARILALASLSLGLADAARLLGVSAGSLSPISQLGPGAFVVLSILCLSRLFAAVGLWIYSRWGAVLLAGAIAVELLLYVTGSGWVALGLIGFIFKLVTLLATIGLLALARFLDQHHAHG